MSSSPALCKYTIAGLPNPESVVRVASPVTFVTQYPEAATPGVTFAERLVLPGLLPEPFWLELHLFSGSLYVLSKSSNVWSLLAPESKAKCRSTRVS